MSKFIGVLLVILAISIVLWARFKIITSKVDIKISLGGVGFRDFISNIGKGITSIKSTLIITVYNGNGF